MHYYLLQHWPMRPWMRVVRGSQRHWTIMKQSIHSTTTLTTGTTPIKTMMTMANRMWFMSSRRTKGTLLPLLLRKLHKRASCLYGLVIKCSIDNTTLALPSARRLPTARAPSGPCRSARRWMVVASAGVMPKLKTVTASTVQYTGRDSPNVVPCSFSVSHDRQGCPFRLLPSSHSSTSL